MNFANPIQTADIAELPADEEDCPPGKFVVLDLAFLYERRQQFVDALPLPTAILCEDKDGHGLIECANALFLSVSDGAVAGQRIDRLTIFDNHVRDRLNLFAAGQERVGEFELTVEVEGRTHHHLAKLSKLEGTEEHPRRLVLSLIDRTLQIETECDLRRQTVRDSLTGFLNRAAFTDAMAQWLVAAGDFVPHAVVVIDLTRFSRINESIGAAAGDRLLAAFASRLLSVLAPGSLVARVSGDEFGLLLKAPGGGDDITAFAARIREALVEPFQLGDLAIRVDCAFGAALLTHSGEIAEEMLRNAQFALRRAKVTGRLQLYRPEEARAAWRRFAMETELRRAIEAGQLELHFQPLVALATGQVTGFEALARWEHPEWGHVPPAEFIAVAEESGLVVPLGRWALDRALATLAAWDRKCGYRLPLSMSVNLSAIQIQRDEVPAMVAEALERHGIEGRRLLLEVTESAIIQDPQAATEVLNAMRDLEVRIALDDFGTGYTSLSYLQRLPIDMLKMDGSFVTGMLDDPDATAIVRAILSLAGSMKLVTTAEGIESEELARTLRALGCTKGQGFHFAPPLWPDAALSYFVARSA